VQGATLLQSFWEEGTLAAVISSKPDGTYSEYLAIINNYHLPRKNASYRFVILRGDLWGGRFQMAVIGGARVPAGTKGIFQAKN